MRRYGHSRRQSATKTYQHGNQSRSNTAACTWRRWVAATCIIGVATRSNVVKTRTLIHMNPPRRTQHGPDVFSMCLCKLTPTSFEESLSLLKLPLKFVLLKQYLQCLRVRTVMSSAICEHKTEAHTKTSTGRRDMRLQSTPVGINQKTAHTTQWRHRAG